VPGHAMLTRGKAIPAGENAIPSAGKRIKKASPNLTVRMEFLCK